MSDSERVTAGDYDEDYYQLLAEHYQSKTVFSRDRVTNLRRLIRVREGERLLDLGCGVGVASVECANSGASVVGLDYSPKAIEKALVVCETHARSRVDFVVADCANIPLIDECLDKVLCADLVEHLYPQEYLATVREAHRVLKPGGEIIIYTPSGSHFFEVGRHCVGKRVKRAGRFEKLHVDLKSMDYIISSMETNGFAVKRNYYLPSHVPLLRNIEKVAMHLPVISQLFRRRICVSAGKEAEGRQGEKCG